MVIPLLALKPQLEHDPAAAATASIHPPSLASSPRRFSGVANASILHALNGEVHPLISYRGAIRRSLPPSP